MDVSDVLGPKGGAGVAGGAIRERGLIPRGTLVTEDPCHTDAA